MRFKEFIFCRNDGMHSFLPSNDAFCEHEQYSVVFLRWLGGEVRINHRFSSYINKKNADKTPKPSNTKL